MSHGITAGRYWFMCDECPAELECINPTFVEARAEFVVAGWTSTKLPGRQWEDWCPKCSVAAAQRHENMKEQDAHRERIKARNAAK